MAHLIYNQPHPQPLSENQRGGQGRLMNIMNIMKHLGGYRAIKKIGTYFKRIWCSKGCFCFINLHNVHKITMRSKKQGSASQRALVPFGDLATTTYLMNIMKTYEGGQFKENFRVQVLEGPDFMKLQERAYFINLHKFPHPGPLPWGEGDWKVNYE